LPGLGAWSRVRDYRSYLLSQMPNVEIYIDNPLTSAEILELGAAHVAVATGAKWRRDGYGRNHQFPIPGADSIKLLTPDDIIAGVCPQGEVLVYDDDHYYMASVIAELLVSQGSSVTFATPESVVSAWTEYTLEQHRIQARLIEIGVTIVTGNRLEQISSEGVVLGCTYSGNTKTIEAASIVMVTSRLPQDKLFLELESEQDGRDSGQFKTLKPIGDCHGPATIAAAVYEGHLFARELGEEPSDIPYERELTELSAKFALP
jgi:dimethylamine/trimethylamine dehydrogenase